VVGFFKDVTAEVGPSADELAKVNDAGKLAQLGYSLAAIGADKLADSAFAAAAALTASNAALDVAANLGAAAARTGVSNDAVIFGERGDRFGRGPGAVAEQNS